MTCSSRGRASSACFRKPASRSLGEAEDAAGLLRLVRLDRPDVAVVDIRMPPTHTDEGLVAARRHPAGASRHRRAGALAVRRAQLCAPPHGGASRGVGYLLKERVFDIATVVDALRRIVDGETVVDPTIVARLVAVAGRRTPCPGSPSESARCWG